jgi:predicted transcriptional regulator
MRSHLCASDRSGQRRRESFTAALAHGNEYSSFYLLLLTVRRAGVLQTKLMGLLQSGSILMSDTNDDEVARDDMLRMAVDVVAAYLSNNQVASSQISEIIHIVFTSLCSLDERPADVSAEAPKPATSIRRSVTPDYIVCLEDGKKLKMLKRHLRTTYNMTPQEYRAKCLNQNRIGCISTNDSLLMRSWMEAM